MLRKSTVILVIILLISVLTITIQGTGVFKDIEWPWKGADEVAEKAAFQGIMYGYSDGNFHPNKTLTNKEALIVFSRLMSKEEGQVLPNNEELLIEYIKNIAIEYDVSLPSDLVYSREGWENTWKDILTGKTLFEQIEDNKYSVTLIPGYFKIYLNEKGYFLFKKGMIPTQIEFYSPFTTIETLSVETLNQPATKGFVMELMSIYDIKRNSTMETRRAVIRQNRVVDTLTKILIEQTVGKLEEDWDNLDLNKYNYVSMSYGGAMQYGILRGIIQPDNTLEDMNRPIKRIELATIIDRINTNDDRETLEDSLRQFLRDENIEVFDIYLNR